MERIDNALDQIRDEAKKMTREIHDNPEVVLQ